MSMAHARFTYDEDGTLLSPHALSRRDRKATQEAMALLRRHGDAHIALAEFKGDLATARMRSLDGACEEAMLGHCFLARLVKPLAGNDPELQDVLQFFVEVSRLGKAEIIGGLVRTYVRDGRRR